MLCDISETLQCKNVCMQDDHLHIPLQLHTPDAASVRNLL